MHSVSTFYVQLIPNYTHFITFSFLNLMDAFTFLLKVQSYSCA